MNDREQIPSDLHDLASPYVLGALDADDRIAFEEHLRQGCNACAQNLRSFADVANLLGESVPATPSARLRDRLLSQVRYSSRVPGILLDRSGLLIERSEELAWRSIAPGIVYKPLYEDSARKYNTSLVRMEAGAHYPSHHHAAIEELFLLSGDLHVENHVMRPGDYCRADSGSIHGETFTDEGCLFLLMASPDNQVVEDRAI